MCWNVQSFLSRAENGGSLFITSPASTLRTSESFDWIWGNNWSVYITNGMKDLENRGYINCQCLKHNLQRQSEMVAPRGLLSLNDIKNVNKKNLKEFSFQSEFRR